MTWLFVSTSAGRVSIRPVAEPAPLAYARRVSISTTPLDTAAPDAPATARPAPRATVVAKAARSRMLRTTDRCRCLMVFVYLSYLRNACELRAAETAFPARAVLEPLRI